MKIKPISHSKRACCKALGFTHNLALLDKISELEVSSQTAQTARNELKLGPSYWAYKHSTVCIRDGTAQSHKKQAKTLQFLLSS